MRPSRDQAVEDQRRKKNTVEEKKAEVVWVRLKYFWVEEGKEDDDKEIIPFRRIYISFPQLNFMLWWVATFVRFVAFDVLYKIIISLSYFIYFLFSIRLIFFFIFYHFSTTTPRPACCSVEKGFSLFGRRSFLRFSYLTQLSF